MNTATAQTSMFPIYSILLLVLFVLSTGCTNSKNTVYFLKNKVPISEIKLKISSDAGLKNILLKDPKMLDSLNKAFSNMKKISVSRGGGFKIWADVTVNKNNVEITSRTLFSKYYGWYLDLDEDT